MISFIMFLMKMLLFSCLSVSVCPFLSPVLFPTTSFLYRKTLWIHWIASPSNSLALLLVTLPSPLDTPSQIPHPRTTSWVPSIPHPSPKDTAASISISGFIFLCSASLYQILCQVLETQGHRNGQGLCPWRALISTGDRYDRWVNAPGTVRL